MLIGLLKKTSVRRKRLCPKQALLNYASPLETQSVDNAHVIRDLMAPGDFLLTDQDFLILKFYWTDLHTLKGNLR